MIVVHLARPAKGEPGAERLWEWLFGEVWETQLSQLGFGSQAVSQLAPSSAPWAIPEPQSARVPRAPRTLHPRPAAGPCWDAPGAGGAGAHLGHFNSRQIRN